MRLVGFAHRTRFLPIKKFPWQAIKIIQNSSPFVVSFRLRANDMVAQGSLKKKVRRGRNVWNN